MIHLKTFTKRTRCVLSLKMCSHNILLQTMSHLKPFAKRKHCVLYLTEIVFTEHTFINNDRFKTVHKERTPCFVLQVAFAIITASSNVLVLAVDKKSQWLLDPGIWVATVPSKWYWLWNVAWGHYCCPGRMARRSILPGPAVPFMKLPHEVDLRFRYRKYAYLGNWIFLYNGTILNGSPCIV
jgi:hypothetical protein